MCACQALWLDTLLQELKLSEAESMKLMMDNKSAINLAKNLVALGKSKHIEIWNQVKKGRLRSEFYRSEMQVAEILPNH